MASNYFVDLQLPQFPGIDISTPEGNWFKVAYESIQQLAEAIATGTGQYSPGVTERQSLYDTGNVSTSLPAASKIYVPAGEDILAGEAVSFIFPYSGAAVYPEANKAYRLLSSTPLPNTTNAPFGVVTSDTIAGDFAEIVIAGPAKYRYGGLTPGFMYGMYNNTSPGPGYVVQLPFRWGQGIATVPAPNFLLGVAIKSDVLIVAAMG